MFGFNLLPLYFFINIVYTLSVWLFLHNIIADKITKQFNIEFNKKVLASMNIIYIMLIFIGSIFVVFDFLQLLINPRCSLWLYWIYGDQEKQ